MRRYARTHGPFPTAQIGRRYDTDLTTALRELERSGELVRGELLPGGASASGATRTCCAGSAGRAWPPCEEAEAVDQAELARFVPAWQNVDVHRPAGAGLTASARHSCRFKASR